jgi:shikimate kinase
VKADKIYLVGFMASGKSSLARALAARLGWRAEDIDELIEAREGMPIADIFARRGEPYFRNVEKAVLRLVVPLRYAVVATGGGTFMDPENRALIKQDGVSIWIDVPFEDLLARLPTDGSRPLAADRASLERLFLMRRLAYEEADYRLDARRAPVGELVDRVIDWLDEQDP